MYHEHVVENDLWKKNIQAYLACVAFVDEQIGRLLDAWYASSHGEDGIVMLWGDNGWHLGEKEHWSKFALWREATRVPLVISVPELEAKNKRNGSAVSLVDLYPTLVDLCNLKTNQELDGYSLAPLLRDPTITWNKGVPIAHGKDNIAVATERYHYIHYRDETKELYDFIKDPNQHENLALNPDYMPIINSIHGKFIPHNTADNKPFGKEDLLLWIAMSLLNDLKSLK